VGGWEWRPAFPLTPASASPGSSLSAGTRHTPFKRRPPRPGPARLAVAGRPTGAPRRPVGRGRRGGPTAPVRRPRLQRLQPLQPPQAALPSRSAPASWPWPPLTANNVSVGERVDERAGRGVERGGLTRGAPALPPPPPPPPKIGGGAPPPPGVFVLGAQPPPPPAPPTLISAAGASALLVFVLRAPSHRRACARGGRACLMRAHLLLPTRPERTRIRTCVQRAANRLWGRATRGVARRVF